MTYVYLNTYSNGYLYIGSHTWSGQGLDPSYFGSSKVANYYHWKPIKIEILEVVTDKLKTESKYIIDYCNKFGIASCAKMMAHASNNHWVDKFKNGLMLNCHANNMEQALNAISKDNLTKHALSNLNNPAVKNKSILSRKAHARKLVLSNGISGSVSELESTLNLPNKSLSHAGKDFKSHGFYIIKSLNIEVIEVIEYHDKQWVHFYKKPNADKRRFRKCECSDGFKGTIEELANHLGISRSSAYRTVSKAFKNGVYKFNDLTIKPIYETIVDVDYQKFDCDFKRESVVKKSVNKQGRKVLLENFGEVDNKSIVDIIGCSRKVANGIISATYREGYWRYKKQYLFLPLNTDKSFEQLRLELNQRDTDNLNNFVKSNHRKINVSLSDKQLEALNNGRNNRSNSN